MENRRNSKGEQLAPVEAPFRIYGSPAQFRRDGNEAQRAKSRPEISIEIGGEAGRPKDQFLPGDFLTCEYSINVPAATDVHAFEASVIWITSGKGDEDIGVHFFERRSVRTLPSGFLKQTQRLSTVLPATPLSYSGRIVKIGWCVRVRLFLEDSSQVTQDQLFVLGNAEMCDAPEDTSDEGADGKQNDS